MKKYWSIVLVCFALLLLNCTKEEDLYGEVFVQGRVYDDNRQQPLKNLKVIIYDVECRNFACSYNKVLDSTRTDDNGYYEMSYRPKNHNGLYVQLGHPERAYALKTGQEHQQPIKSGHNTINYNLRKTTVLKTRVIVTNNPHPPLRISDRINNYTARVYGTNNDTIVYLRGVANQLNVLTLVVATPNYSTYFRARHDHIQFGTYVDTLDITITADPNTFPITKY